jgi:ATP-dependent RNA helicase DDX55/SPB4
MSHLLSSRLVSLQNTYILTPTKYKMATLLKLLQAETAKQAGETVASSKKIIVYFATCACVDYFYKVMRFHWPMMRDDLTHLLD